MTTATAHRQRGLRLSLLTLLTLISAIGFGPAADASASTRAAAETRVRANDTPTTALVAARDLGSSTVAGVSSVWLRQQASATGVATKALPPSSPGRVVANALEPHELAQAESLVGYRGGTFVGNATRGAPGIDGMLDGIPASLKTYSGSSPAGVLSHVSRAEASAAKAGYSGVEVFVDAPGVSRSALIDFGTNGPLAQIPAQGTVSSVYVRTADGWVIFPG